MKTLDDVVDVNLHYIRILRSKGSSVTIVSRLWAGWLSWTLGRGRCGMFCLRHRVQTGTGTYPASFQMRTARLLSRGWSGWAARLTTHLHLVLRLRIR